MVNHYPLFEFPWILPSWAWPDRPCTRWEQVPGHAQLDSACMQINSLDPSPSHFSLRPGIEASKLIMHARLFMI